MLAAMTTGSGNAPFYAFVEMIPKLAPLFRHQPGLPVDPDAAGIEPRTHHFTGFRRGGGGGREWRRFLPFEVVKRTSVPVIVGLLVVIIATEILVPGRRAPINHQTAVKRRQRAPFLCFNKSQQLIISHP